MNPQQQLRFDGDVYVHSRDNARLVTQMGKIFDLMKDERWRTLADIAFVTNSPEASVSAQLRNFRKPRFGGYEVERRHISAGLFEYRILTGEEK